MIHFEHIRIRLENRILIEDADLKVNAGDHMVIRGISGSGKSSLLKCIVGACRPSDGRITVNGTLLTADTVSAIRAQIAYIGQEPVLGADTVRAALLLPFTFRAHRHQRPEKQQIDVVLHRLHLTPDILNQPCGRISGGEKQRIAVARALLLNKRIFLADEVTSALDKDSRSAVMDALFAPDTTLLSAAHDAEWVARCSRVADIANGRLEEVRDGR